MELNSRLKSVERAVTSEDGTRLHVTSCGDPAHHPVVLLHGGGQTRGSWRNTAATLAENDWSCLLPDFRGHGDSGFAQDYDLERFADDVTCIANTLCKRPPVAVGASMGGLSALMAQARQPLLRALILVDIVPDWEDKGIEQILSFLGAHPEGFDSIEDAALAVASYLPHRRSTPDSAGLRNNLRRREGRWHWHWDPVLLKSAQSHVDQWQEKVTKACSKINIPTLLISGERSEVVSAEGADKLTQLIPHAEHVVIENAHHMVVGDSNQQFTDAVLAFLRTLDNVNLSQEDSLCLVS